MLLCLLPCLLTAGNMTSGGMRATSLSAVTKLDAGTKLSSYNCARHWLYCVLTAGVSLFPVFFKNCF